MMKKHGFYLAFALTILIACTNRQEVAVDETYRFDGTVQSGDVVMTKSEEEFVHLLNDFGFHLARGMYTDDNGLVLSPFSVAFTLGMVAGGGLGATAEEISKTLFQCDLKQREMDWFFMKMSGLIGSKEGVKINNAIYYDDSFILNDVFIAASKRCFNATIDTFDALDLTNSELERNAIICSNALTFKANWATPFPEILSSRKNFFMSDGTEKEVVMMNRGGQVPYMHCDIGEMIRLDYEGGEYALYVLLPEQGKSLFTIWEQFDAATFTQLCESLEIRTVDVFLPEYQSEDVLNVTSTLKKMGIHAALNPQEADFSRMTDESRLYLRKVYQNVSFRVFEKGTEGEALSVGEIGPYFDHPDDGASSVQFVANHPFIYMLCEQKSGTILFMGAFTG